MGIGNLGRIAIAALATASLAACLRPEPIVLTKVVLRDVPVMVPCLKPGQKPSQPKRLTEDDPVAPDNLTQIIARLRAKLIEWQDGYGPSADELLVLCEKVPTP